MVVDPQSMLTVILTSLLTNVSQGLEPCLATCMAAVLPTTLKYELESELLLPLKFLRLLTDCPVLLSSGRIKYRVTSIPL